MSKQTESDKARLALLRDEPWANLAVAIGYDPLDVEGQGRDILKRMSARGVTAQVRAPESDETGQ